MKLRVLMKVLAPLGVVVAIATACQGTPVQYSGHIKQSDAQCTYVPNYQEGFASPTSFTFDCSFQYSGSGEHPYLNVWVSGCTLRVNATDGDRWQSTRQCLGDGIDNVTLQLCQTRGGPFPDDCDSKRKSPDYQ